MEKELQCTKIKDGLYLGNFRTAQDAQFLVTNKFAYIVNCSLETPNYYEGQGIKYLKFKLGRDKPHKLWDESLKKLKKLDKFIQTCEQNSMCCLIHSFDGANRSLVMIVAFLMNRYRWALSKTLEFIRSKQIFIGLSQHYIEQLQKLEDILNINQPRLSTEWRIEYLTQEEEIISKTYLNSLEIEFKPTMPHKKQKRVMWKDLVEKEKKKELKQQLKATKTKQSDKNTENAIYLTKKNQKPQIKDKGKAKKDGSVSKKSKLGGNKSKGQICFRYTKEEEDDDKTDERAQNSSQHHSNRFSFEKQVKKDEKEQFFLEDEDQLLKLIKKNLKVKRKNENMLNCTSGNEAAEEKVYNVTINNYIKPNINILNNLLDEKNSKAPSRNQKKKQKRPNSTWNKNPNKQKINRTMSQKQGIRSTNTNMSVKQRSLKNISKKNMDISPRKNIKKNEKTTSFHNKI